MANRIKLVRKKKNTEVEPRRLEAEKVAVAKNISPTTEAEKLMFELQRCRLGKMKTVPKDLAIRINRLLKRKVKMVGEANKLLEDFALETFKAKLDGTNAIARLLVEEIRETWRN